MVMNRFHDIQIDRETTASNFQVISKLLVCDNDDEDVESVFGDRGMAWEDISNCCCGGKFSLKRIFCRM